MKIEDYTIVFDSDPKRLIESIRKGIKKGYQPYGPLCVTDSGTLRFTQAMVKYASSYTTPQVEL
jgi:hypothetical protein